MKTLRVAAAAICLCFVCDFPARANQPVYRLSSSCEMPSMPARGASKEDWNTYAALMRDYKECVSEKASKYGSKAKESLEDVGNAVIDMKKSAAGFFAR